MPLKPPPLAIRLFVLTSVTAMLGCAQTPGPRNQRDMPRHRRGIENASPFLAFRGRAKQMGDLAQVAATYRVIAIDAEPLDNRFSADDIAVLRNGGRNIVLGIMDVGFCDRTQSQWKTAPDGLLPCAANLSGQIGERRAHPQEVWMSPEDFEYERLLVEHVGTRLVERAGVDGFLLDGLDILDHGPDADEAPCDGDCVTGGIALLMTLRREFPDLVFLMNGGISPWVRDALVKTHVAELIDGIVAEGVYTPTYDADREAELTAWRKLDLHVAGQPFAVITQDYVGSCYDEAWAKTVYRASHAHGFSPAVSLSPVARPRVCSWGF